MVLILLMRDLFFGKTSRKLTLIAQCCGWLLLISIVNIFKRKKKCGNVIHGSRMAPFNNLIFENNLLELPSSGVFHTWYNQRTDNPIHLKLDRMLSNDAWIIVFPYSNYKVVNSSISDHTPLILKSITEVRSSPRFMFKVFCCHICDFWDILISIFDAPL